MGFCVIKNDDGKGGIAGAILRKGELPIDVEMELGPDDVVAGIKFSEYPAGVSPITDEDAKAHIDVDAILGLLS